MVRIAALLALLLAARPAAAAGSHFVLELETGLSEGAHEGATPGLAFGLGAGLTWRFSGWPVRFHHLLGARARNSHVLGEASGGAYAADRRDVDLVFGNRLVVPIVEPLRVYGEVGVGYRWTSTELARSGGLGAVATVTGDPLLLFAVGLTARLSERFSIGLRGELDPGRDAPDLLEALTGRPQTSDRLALLAQVGVHF